MLQFNIMLLDQTIYLLMLIIVINNDHRNIQILVFIKNQIIIHRRVQNKISIVFKLSAPMREEVFSRRAA